MQTAVQFGRLRWLKTLVEDEVADHVFTEKNYWVIATGLFPSNDNPFHCSLFSFALQWAAFHADDLSCLKPAILLSDWPRAPRKIALDSQDVSALDKLLEANVSNSFVTNWIDLMFDRSDGHPLPLLETVVSRIRWKLEGNVQRFKALRDEGVLPQYMQKKLTMEVFT